MYTSLLVEMSRQEGSSKVISEHGKDSLRAVLPSASFLLSMKASTLPIIKATGYSPLLSACSNARGSG